MPLASSVGVGLLSQCFNFFSLRCADTPSIFSWNLSYHRPLIIQNTEHLSGSWFYTCFMLSEEELWENIIQFWTLCYIFQGWLLFHLHTNIVQNVGILCKSMLAQFVLSLCWDFAKRYLRLRPKIYSKKKFAQSRPPFSFLQTRFDPPTHL